MAGGVQEKRVDMWTKLARAVFYTVLATVPVIGASDYGTYSRPQLNMWERVLVSIALAVLVAAIGETVIFVLKRSRHP